MDTPVSVPRGPDMITKPTRRNSSPTSAPGGGARRSVRASCLTSLPGGGARRVVLSAGVVLAILAGVGACSSNSATPAASGRSSSSDRPADLEIREQFAAETAAASVGGVVKKTAAVPIASADGSLENGVATGVGSFPVDRKIIATADVSVWTKNVSTAAATLRASVSTAGGYVETEQAVTTPTPFDEGGDVVSGPVKTSSITMRLRVPTARFEGLLKRLDTLGVVTSRNVGAQDVTSEVVDVDSRIISAKASITRMQVLYEKAQSIADVAAIEGELSRRQADLESLLARQKQLADQTSLATIGVTLFDDSVPQPAGPKTGVAKAFDDALETFGNALRNTLVAVAAVLPFLVLGLLLGFPAYRIVRRRSVRRVPSEAPDETPSATTAAPPSPTN